MRLAYFVCLVLSIAAVGSVNLPSELQDFYDILPKVRLGFIFTKHYLFDSDFNTAYSYLKSIDLQSYEMQKVGNVPEVQEIFNYLGLKENNHFDQHSFKKYARSLEIPFEATDEDYIMERSLNSFIDSVVYILPNNDIKNLIRKKVASDSDFSRFYRLIMDPQFKVLVYKARNAAELSGFFNTLKYKKIEVDHILQVAFRLLDQWRL